VDAKWALEVAGTAPDETFLDLLRQAFNEPSVWLRDVAYKQAGRLATIPSAARVNEFETPRSVI